MEIWKEIPGFEKYYVSTYGRIKSYKTYQEGVILKQQTSKKGYLCVSVKLSNGKNKMLQVHRVVLMTFCPCKNMESLEVNHKDENKQNNHLNNLEWMTHAQNVAYGTGSQRSADKQKKKIKCVENGIVYDSMKEASQKLNVNYGNISSCCSGRLKTVNGMHFELVA